MCGFLTEIVFNTSKEITKKEQFEKLLSLSKHRGPDSTEIQIGGYYQLGFNRLAVLDLSENGNQPVYSPSERFHVVFNGEIYNYKLLIQKYSLTDLRSSSDTEVLCCLLDKLGIESTIKELNGMFAIAIIDTLDKSLYLTRDFAGIKPLFFGVSQSGVVSASQFDQIFKHPWFSGNLSLRKDAMKTYFGLGYMPAPDTIYDHIFQVNPGELIRFFENGTISKNQIVQFDSMPEEVVSMTDDTYLKRLEKVVGEVVERQSQSDVPLAAFLSGGIDSPLICAMLKRLHPNVKAFTVKVSAPHLNESGIAKSYADALDIEQMVKDIKDSDLLEIIERHFEAYPEPFGDYSSIPTYLITQMAKQNHTVMLSGDGGDELFFGYPRMLDIMDKRHWFKIPFYMRIFLVRVTNTLGITKTWSPFFRRFDDFVMNKHLHISENILKNVFKDTPFVANINEGYKLFINGGYREILHSLRKNEFYNHLQRILIKVDRASMKHSLEVRVPFLDKDIIDFAWQGYLPLNDKADLKKPLKLLLSQFVPKSIVNTKKMGFTVPLQNWLHNDLKEDVLKMIYSVPFYGDTVMDISILRKYVDEFYEGKHNNAWGVWHIYAWQKWAYCHANK
ncbi:asparagine synthase (glutamine-hydrolyzing) [Aestuariibaculum sp. M13]|uniref:asparagine synthase (glutamine-hydrolyzing) n=1 Tax=Aestuariibaculum sp. M13 TaxID=2967132 RepID=UPI00215A01F8|nr:asparagine synthase (glutamine-hydrolyzing) [Aestuariibaculum sp. M13]MCR8666361.1 asparagine synthase (glutamine-hydrolyzing) [Aestuariibaculum sp. M13]